MIIDAYNNVPDVSLNENVTYGKDTLNVAAMNVGFGDTSFKSDDQGIWLGSKKFTTAPFKVDMDGNVIATSADISGNITVGGNNNENGVISVEDSSGVEKVKLDKDGILINDGKIVIKNDEYTTFLDSKGLVSSAVFGIYGDKETGISNIVGNYGPTILSSPSIEITTKRINTNILLFLTITSGGYPTNPSSNVTNSGFAISTYEENIIQDYLLYGPFIEYEAYQIISSGAMDNMKITTRSATNTVTLADIGTYNFKVSIEQTGSNLTTVISSIFLSAVVLGQ